MGETSPPPLSDLEVERLQGLASTLIASLDGALHEGFHLFVQCIIGIRRHHHVLPANVIRDFRLDNIGLVRHRYIPPNRTPTQYYSQGAVREVPPPGLFNPSPVKPLKTAKIRLLTKGKRKSAVGSPITHHESGECISSFGNTLNVQNP